MIARVVLLLLAVLVPGAARAAEKPKPYALIFGTVFDPDGHTLYAVKVKIRRDGEKKARWEIYSNHTGEFAQRVPPGPGDYVVWADVKGYKLPDGRRLQPGPEVKVHIDSDERSDIGLHLNW
ncbi:MAG: carboxypeptidase-like regulatory domain-containing protein [Terriglobales bacterium]